MRKILIPLFLFFMISVKCWALFPTTYQLDNFTRANSTTSPGPGWSNNIGGQDWGISSNLAYAPTVTSYASATWTSSFSSSNEEVWATFSTPPSNETFLQLRMNEISSATGYDGYSVGVDGSTGQIILQTITNNSPSAISGGTFTQTVSSGDTVGGVIVGSLFCAEYEHNGVWSQLGCVTNTTYSSGAYLAMISTDTTVRLSQFGGGNYGTFGFPSVLNNATINNATLN